MSKLNRFESCLRELAEDRFNAEAVKMLRDEWGTITRVEIYAYRQGKLGWWLLASTHDDACLLALAYRADQIDPVFGCNAPLTLIEG